MEKLLKIALASLLCVNTVSSPVFAKNENGGNIDINTSGEKVTIGNSYIERTYSRTDGIWKTESLLNKRINKNFMPAEGSEDFVINLVDQREVEAPEVTYPTQKLDRTNWTPTMKNKNGVAFDTTAKMFDGNDYTYVNEYTKAGFPISIEIDLGEKQTVGSFSYLKRPGYHQSAYGKNGTLGKFKLYVSEDGVNWTAAGAGEFTKDEYNLHEVTLEEQTKTDDGTYQAGTKLFNVGDVVYGNFDEVQETRYVRIDALSDVLGGTSEFCGAEVNLYSDQKTVTGGGDLEDVDLDIRASELTVEDVTKTDNEVRVSFATHEQEGVNWDIDMVTFMEDDKHYMNTYLEIDVDKPEEARIDYIDFDAFVIPEGTEGVWSIPDLSKVSSMWIGKHELMLGQPIYADGLFFGSEFPAQETDINDETNTMQIRYYSGKNFTQMKADNQLTGDTLRTWNNVVGAAQGTDTEVVQTDLFDYIEDIATPTEFRKQYNSWYDNMMNISDESIEKSFSGAEKGLAQNGVEPLDSYVVDDGWNNYYDGKYTGASSSAGSGTPNQTGFWEFNNKFPNELYTSTELTSKFQSTFGVWVGPQGGYNFFDGFAKFLEEKGTAERQSDYWGCICTGSRLYLKNFANRFIDYQTRFNIDYWKWDGFAVRPCTNASHHHMTGGENNMYFTSDMWEAWTDVFEDARAARAAEGKGLWINATCYVNLSPWLLQWVNTIWIQDSGDTGQAGDTTAARHQQKIYYRDNVYYNLYKQNELQFPLKNIYNHDPIYGVSDGSNATTDVFREFLFDNAMRGTAFWELYYSPSLMDEEKWMVTSDALAFAEANHDVLKNAKLFVEAGKRPTNGVYGYSAWNNEKGFVSFVNPTNTEKTYTLALTDVNGVPQGMADLAKAEVYPYTAETDGTTVSYGDELTVTLAPFSSQIYQFGIDDTTAPEVVSAKITDTDKVQVRFNERIDADAQFTVDGTSAEAALLADYRTVELTVEGLAETAEVSVAGLKDVYGNEAEAATLNVRSNVIASVDSKADLDEELVEYEANGKSFVKLDGQTYTLTENGFEGTTDFGISMGISTTDSDVTLVSQENGFTLRIDEDGYVVFDVNGQSVSSKEDVTTVVEKAHGTFGTDEYVETTTTTATIGKVNDGAVHTINAVREPNGMIKVYVDGAVCASTYDENNLNEAVSKAPIVFGDEAFNGFVADVKVTNSAVYYDEAEAYYNSYDLTSHNIILDRTDWTATACSQQTATVGTGGDGAAMDVLDGKTNTYWHSNWSGGDNCTDHNHWLELDFNGTVDFDLLKYVARPGASNGTWQTVTVVGINEDGSEEVIKENEKVNLKDNAYEFVFEETQSYAGVKFLIQGLGGFASGAEVTAERFQPEKVSAAEVNEFMNYADRLYSEVAKEDYTETSYEDFTAAVEAVKAVNPFAMNLDEFNALKADLEEAYANLEKLVYTVTVDGEVFTTGKYNTKVTVEAKPVEGKEFTAWLLDGKVVSTDAKYTFFISEDMDLETCYEEIEVNADALLTNTVLTRREDGKGDVKFVAQLVVPEGYTVENAGLVWSSKEGTELSLENTNLKPTYINTISTSNQFSVTIKGMPAGRFIRGKIFATVVDAEGNESVVYSEEARVVNK